MVQARRGPGRRLRRRRNDGAVVAVAALVAACALAAPPARADPPQQIFRPPTLLDPQRCVSVDERARVERSRSPEAFDEEIGVYLGPFFWASKDRSFMQVMLVYWRDIDVQGSSRFELIFPLWARTCDPDADVWVGPLGLAASKTDAAGTAGYIGPYFTRRDQQAETDVLFPFYWSFREPGASFLIAGPWYDVSGAGRRAWGLAPLYFGARAPDSYYEISPAFARWGDDDVENLWFAQTWLRTSRAGWDAASLPFYFGGASTDGGAYRHTIPLLLTSLWSERDDDGAARTGTVVGPYFDLRDHDGGDQTAGVIPFAFWGRRVATRFAPARAWFVAPLLLGGKVDVADRETWFVGPGYWSTSSIGSDFGLAPLYFGARSLTPGGFEMDVVPPLVFGRWDGDTGRGLVAGPWYDVSAARRDDGNEAHGAVVDGTNGAPRWRRYGLVPLAFGGVDEADADRGASTFLVGPGYGLWSEARADGSIEHRGWIAQTWWSDTPQRRSSTSLPFWFHAEDDVARTMHTIIPPLAYASWRGRDDDGIVVGPYFDLRRGTSALGDDGDATDRTAGVVPFAFWGRRDGADWFAVPLLLAGRWADADRDTTFVGPGYLSTSTIGSDFGLAPLYFGARSKEPGGFEMDVVPPLLFGRWSGDDGRGLIAGPWYDVHDDDARSRRFGLVPLAFGGVDGVASPDGVPHDGDAPATGNADVADGARREFLVGPGYGFWHDESAAGDVSRRGWIAQTWWSDTPQRRSSTSLPFWFHAEDDVARTMHTIIPPLAYASWRGRDDDGLVVGPYFDLRRGTSGLGDDGDATDRTAGVVPFAFWGRSDGADWFAAPLLLAGRWVDAGRDTTIVGPGYLSTSTIGSDFGIAPLYFGARSKDPGGFEMDVVPPLLFGRWTRDDGGGLIAGPWYDVRGARRDETDDAQRREDDAPQWRRYGLVPLAFGGADAGDAEAGASSFLVGPGYGLWSEALAGGGVERRGWIALTWWSDAPTHRGFASLPFVLHGEDDVARSAWTAVPLLLSASWNDHRGARGQGRSTTIVPPLLLFRATDGPDELLVAGAWWEAKTKDGWDLWVPPLYFAGGARRGTQTPLTKLVAPDGLAFDTTEARDFRYRVIPPLLTASWERADGGGLVAGPWYDVREGGARHRGLVPLAFAGETKDGDYLVGPGYGFWSEVLPEGAGVARRGWIAQTWWTDAPQRRSLTSMPFVFHAEDDVAQTAHTIIPPLAYASWRGRDDQGLVVGPYFDLQRGLGEWGGTRTGDDGDRGDRITGVAPFAFWGQRDGADWFAAPLLLAGRWADADRDTTIVGPGYLSTSMTGSDFGIAPLYFGARSQEPGGFEMDVVPPLLFGRWSGDAGSGLIAGPWYDVHTARGAGDAVAPSRRYGLVPFAFGGVDEERGARSAGDGAGLAGVAADNARDVRDIDEAGERREFLVGPGYGFWREPASSPGGVVTRGWIAQTWWTDAPQRRSLTSVPFVFQAQDDVAMTAHTIIPPLAYASWRGRDDDGKVVGPYFDLRRDDGDRTSGVAPFAFWGQRDGVDWFAAPPVLFARWAGVDGRGLIAGPWYDVQNERARSRRYGLVPFAFGGVDGDDDFLVGPGYGFWRDDDERRGWIAQTWWSDAPGRRSFNSLPFWFHAEDDVAGSAHTIVPPLLFAAWADGRGESDVVVGQTWWTERPDGWSLWSAPFYFGQDGDRGSGRWYHVVPPLLSGAWGDVAKGERGLAVAPPIFFHVEDRRQSTTLALLWFAQRDTATGDHAEALVPFWFAGRRGADTWRVAAPVYWSFESPGASTTIAGPWFDRRIGDDRTRGIVPIWFEHEDPHGAVSMLSPLFWSWRIAKDRRNFLLPTLTYWSTVDDESLLLAPLVYLRSDPLTSDTVVFPFWWDFRGEDLHATVASGFWWDFEWRASQRRLQLAPGYLHWEDREEDFRIAGPISWSKSKVDLAWSFHVFPFASVWSFHPDHVRWRALLGALGYERERDVEQWMVLGIRTPKTTIGGAAASTPVTPSPAKPPPAGKGEG